MYKKILILLLFSFSAISYAQNVDVKGTITEGSSGQPLPGVNILIKNTSRGATTDFDGIFAINDVPINSVLVISYLGYVSQEIAVVNSDPINIVLQEDTETLNEVVVIGYGSQTKIINTISI